LVFGASLSPNSVKILLLLPDADFMAAAATQIGFSETGHIFGRRQSPGGPPMHSATVLDTTVQVTDDGRGDGEPLAAAAMSCSPRQRRRAEETFDASLLHLLEDFLDRWQTDPEPPSLADFLPQDLRAANQEALVQFVMADLDFRYRHGCPRRVEEYVRQFPELAPSGCVPCELIFEEFQVRRAHGETVKPEEYFERFPDRAEELQAWLAIAAPGAASTVLGGRKHVLQVAEGDHLDDFQLLSLLGEGAFGRVFLARQTSMHRLVALKVSADQGVEPQTLAQLDHAGIVRVYDQRRLPERGLRLLYMQYVAGGTLHDVVRRLRETPPERRRGSLLLKAVDESVERGGQPPVTWSTERQRLAEAPWPEVVCRVGMQIAQALDYAHRRGVLHRDLKPANVLLAADGSPKLADFNVSSSHLADMLGAAHFGGSLAYMSPEQLAACHPHLPTEPEDLDPRSDIYSLGVVLFELLYGERPFDDRMHEDGWEATLEAMLAARQSGPPVVPEDSADSLRRVLHAILRRCLAPDPRDRYPDAQRLVRELRLCLNDRAREILQEPPRGWRRWAQEHPMMAGMVVGYASHAVTAAFAALYIYFAIIHHAPPVQQRLWNLELGAAGVLGAVAGIAAVWFFGRHVVAAMKSPLGQVREGARMADIRKQSLRLAPLAAAVAIHNWTLSGVIYIFVQWWLAGEVALRDCLNILGSHLVGGCIALVYPVLGGAVVTIRAYYPALVARSPGEPHDAVELERLASCTSLVLPLSGVIPILALAPFALFADPSASFPRAVAVGFVAAASLVAIPFAWRMSRGIQADVAALLQASGEEGARRR
jgi:serine/threonine protein kinase